MQIKTLILLPMIITSLITGTNADLVLSNTQLNSGRLILQREISIDAWHATPFTTDGSDYSLTSITAEITDSNPAGTLFMEIWSVDATFATPDASLARLSLSANQPGQKTFTGNVSLVADTSYFIVTGVDNGGGQWNESVNFSNPLGADFNVDSGPWTLETIYSSGSSFKTSYNSPDFGVSWSSDSLLNAPLRMDIQATVPEPYAISLIGLGGFIVILSRRIKGYKNSSVDI